MSASVTSHRPPKRPSGGAALDDTDALFALRDRLFGLRCAISGAAIASPDDRRGLLQLVEEAANELSQLCERVDTR